VKALKRNPSIEPHGFGAEKKECAPRNRMRGYAQAMPNEDDISHEETTDPLVADARNFYKVENWTRDGTKVNSLLYAGNSIGRK
jgi:hypothetical protein